MAYEFTYLEELTTLTEFGAEQVRAATDLSTVNIADLPDGAFNIFHFDDPIVNGLEVTERNAVSIHQYTGNVDTCLYATFGADSLADRAVVGQPVVGATTPTDIITAWDPTGSHKCALLLFNVEVLRVQEMNEDDAAIMFCFQVEQGGTWRTISTSERFYSVRDHVLPNISSDLDADCGLITLVDSATLPAAGIVTGVRACVSLYTAAVNARVYLNRWNISFLPMLAEEG
jgi:hypothetical protein